MLRTRKIIAGAMLALSVSSMAASAQTQIIQDMMMANCSPESRDSLSTLVRQAIEDKVRRAEASILPPSPVGDLACLQDLMTAPLDSFSNVGSLMDTLRGSMSGSLGNIPGLGGGGGIGAQVCAFAAERWSELTGPLTMSLADLQGSTTSVSNVWDSFDMDLNRLGNGSTGTATNTGGGIRDGDLDGIEYTNNTDTAPGGSDGTSSVGDMTEEELRQMIIDSMGGGTTTTPTNNTGGTTNSGTSGNAGNVGDGGDDR